MNEVDSAAPSETETPGDAALTRVASNVSTYSSARVVRSYKSSRGLFPAEHEVINRYRSNFTGDVLDIAIGAGRTTEVLAGISQRYVGIDYSEAMVSAASGVVMGRVARRTQLLTLDMRDVPDRFSGQRFDAIFISYNGIDYIPWGDRNVLLRGLRSLLKESGVLVFSTHDLSMQDSERRFKIREDLRIDGKLVRSLPVSAALRLARLPLWLLRALPNRWRNRRLERHFGDYAYVNDMGENYGVVTTYVSREAQIEKLAACGYRHVEVLHPWLNDQYTSFNYFICRPSR